MTGEPRDEREIDGGHWRECLEDAASIASEYREQGWDVVTVSTRDVVPWTDAESDHPADGAARPTAGADTDLPSDGPDRPSDGADRPSSGFAVLAPDDEFDALRTAVEREDAAFDAAEIYRRTVGDDVLAIAVELDGETETAAVVPLYYRREEASAALEAALERGELLVQIRPDDRDDWVSFTHDDPALFVATDEDR